MGMVSILKVERGGMKVPARTREDGRPFRIDVQTIVHDEVQRFGEDKVKDLSVFEFAEIFKKSLYPIPSKEEIANVINSMPPIILANSQDPNGVEIQIHSFDVKPDGLLIFKTNGDSESEAGMKIISNAHVAVYMAAMIVLIRQRWDYKMDPYGFIV